MNQKRKIPMMLILILIIQIMLPTLTIIYENLLTLKSIANSEEQYYINTAQDLWDFAQKVNNGDTFQGVNVYLTADINLGCNEEKQWVPISIFRGNFYGEGYTISGIYIKSEETKLGLFNKNNGIIENVKISDSYIEVINTEKSGYIGFIASHNSGSIKNCTVANSEIKLEVTSGIYVGGICGYNSEYIDYCENGANIYTKVISATGGIAGENYGIVKTSKNTGEISGDQFSNYNDCGIGGIVGSNHSKVSLCTNYGNIKSNKLSGGVVGRNFDKDTEIIASCNFGTIEGRICGGIVSENGSSSNVSTMGGKIINCYNVGDIIATSKGAAICYSNKVGGEIQNCYYLESELDGIVYDYAENTKIVEKSKTEMKSESFVELLNNKGKQYEYVSNNYPKIDIKSPYIEVQYSAIENNSVIVTLKSNESIREIQGWTISEDGKNLTKVFYINQNLEIVAEDNNYNSTFVKVKIENLTDSVMTEKNYYINNFKDLQIFAQEVNNGNNLEGKNIYLMSDINIDENYTWDVIGKSDETPFMGNFYGNNKKINGINIYEYAYYKGVFGYVKNATIKELEVTGTINGESRYTGGIVAYNQNSYIENCINNINISYDNNLEDTLGASVGGIVGYVSNNSTDILIRQCTNNGKINYLGNGGSSGRVGGIAGYAQKTIIAYCNNNADIVSEKSYYTGGICGEIYAYSTIQGSYNKGNIIIKSIPQGAGGIVGATNVAVLTNNYNMGDVKFEGTGTTNGTASIYNIGGIVGKTHNDIQLDNCYNVGDISSGGIAGKISSTNGIIKNNYYLKESADYGCYDSAIEGIEVIEKDDQEMKKEDFVRLLNNNTSIWRYDNLNINNGYPYMVQLSNILITKQANKIDYIDKQDFDKTGMVVTATYSDDSTKEITNYTIADGTNLKIGKESITISYTENGVTKTVTQGITVQAKMLTGITVTKAPTKIEYIEGYNFDKTGMVVTATYNDGVTKEITNYTVKDGTNLKTGKASVLISYTENGVTKTVTQAIIVKEKLKVSIETYEEKQEGNIKYIENISPETTIKSALENIKTNGNIVIYKGKTKVTDLNTKIATGMTLKISLNDQNVEYTIVVTGDINGDGKLSTTDITKIKKHIIQKENLQGCYERAADIQKDGKISVTDLARVKKALVGLITL